MNHAWEAFEAAKDNPDYFVQHLTYKQTFNNDGSRIITDEMIEAERRKGTSPELLAQEWECSFDSGNQGAYFTREYNDMQTEGRIGTFPVNRSQPLHSVWDLGGTDATAGLLYQIDGKYINIIHCIHDMGKGFKWYLEQAEKIRLSLGCVWGTHWVPHDVNQKHQGWEHTESRLMQARSHGWPLSVVHKVNFEDGIEAIRYTMPKLRIDKNNCAIFLRAIREYQREFDEEKARYAAKPLDNWAVHLVDALRYLSVTYRRLYDVYQEPRRYTTGKV